MAGKIIEPRVNIPPLIEQGDTVSWFDEPFTDDQGVLYNAGGFTLTYSIAGPTAGVNAASAPQGVGWLSEPGTAMASVIGVNVWRGFPFFGISFLAGMKAIPAESYTSGV